MPDGVEIQRISMQMLEPLRHVVRIDVDEHRPRRAARRFSDDRNAPAAGPGVVSPQPPQPHAGHIQVCNLIRLDVM